MSIRLQGSGATAETTSLQIDLTATYAVNLSTTPLSVAFWFKPIPSFVNYDPFLAVSSAAASRASSIETFNNNISGATGQFQGAVGGGSFGMTGSSISVGSWYYTGFSMAVTDLGLNFYIGTGPSLSLILQGTSPYSYGPATPTMRYVTLGQLAQLGLVNSLNGEIAYVRVWNAALTSSQLLAEGKSATPVNTANLIYGCALANTSDQTDLSGHSLTWAANGGLGANYTNGASNPVFPSGPAPSQFFLGARPRLPLTVASPLAALGWLIDRRDRLKHGE